MSKASKNYTQRKVLLSQKWRPLQGAGKGINQPIILGYIQICVAYPNEIAHLDKLMAQLLPDLPKVTSAEESSPHKLLLNRIVHWHIQIQQWIRIPVFDDFQIIKTQKLSQDVIAYSVALPRSHSECTIRTLQWVLGLVNQVLRDSNLSNDHLAEFAESLTQLQRDLAVYRAGGTNSYFLLKAAYELNIPYQSGVHGMHYFGSGQYAKLLFSTITEDTAATGVIIAKNKMLSAQLLSQAGLPCPKHNQVKDLEQALAVAEKLGYPVVVKPTDLDGGKGVYAGVKTPQALKRAFALTQQVSPNILIEKHHYGEDYRFFVFQHQVLKIMRRRAGGVVGDGQHNITQLIDLDRATKKRQQEFLREGKWRIALDEEAYDLLEEQGFSLESVPADGQFVALRRKSNISSGGTHDLLDVCKVHSDYIDLATQVSKAFNLNLVGVDLIAEDIYKSRFESDVIICEVNSQPQVGIRNTPDIYHHIIKNIFADNHSIPIFLGIYIEPTSEMLSKHCTDLAKSLDCNGFSTSEGTWVNGQQYTGNHETGFHAARALNINSDVKSALNVMSAEEILKSGLATPFYDKVMIFRAASDKDQQKTIMDLTQLVGKNCNQLIVKQC